MQSTHYTPHVYDGDSPMQPFGDKPPLGDGGSDRGSPHDGKRFRPVDIGREKEDTQSEIIYLRQVEEETIDTGKKMVSELQILMTQLHRSVAQHDQQISHFGMVTGAQQQEVRALQQEQLGQEQSVHHTQQVTEQMIRRVDGSLDFQQQQLLNLQQTTQQLGNVAPLSFSTPPTTNYGNVCPPPRILPTESVDYPGNVNPSSMLGGAMPGSYSFNPTFDNRERPNLSVDHRQFASGRYGLEPNHGVREDRPRNEGMVPLISGGPLQTPNISSLKVAPPPVFGASRFDQWRKDYLFRKDLFWYISDAQLLSVTGLNAVPALKKFLVQFLRRSRDDPNSRTIANFLKILQEQFVANIEERQVVQIDELLSIRREPSGLIQTFWFRWGELQYNLEGSDIELPHSLLFHRLLKALNVGYAARLAILSSLDCRNLSHTIDNLRRVSTELLGLYRDSSSKHDTMVTRDDQTWELPAELLDFSSDASVCFRPGKKGVEAPKDQERSKLQYGKRLVRRTSRIEPSQAGVGKKERVPGVVSFVSGVVKKTTP